ncbi:MAG: Gfo/Idh/MocA family oxidoreductase [Phycisphaerae bacterium]
MLRVGVIGCGYWGPNLVRVFGACERSCVTAACDLDADRVARIRRSYPTTDAMTNPGDLIARTDVDLVVVATPVESHFSLARQAIEQGKHVLVEKPFTKLAEQAEELIDLAQRRGVILAVDHTFLFTLAVEKMKALIDGGTIGRINYLDSVRINLGLIQEEIDVIWDLAPHDLSIADHLLGRMPLSVAAAGACHTLSGQVDVAYINLDYGEGLIANFHVNWLSPVKVRRMIFGGDRKMIIFDDLHSNEQVRIYDSGATAVMSEDSGNGKRLKRIDYRVGDIWSPHLDRREALAVEADHLVSAIEDGVPLRADGAAGLRVIRILEACQQSLQADGQRISLERPQPMTNIPPTSTQTTSHEAHGLESVGYTPRKQKHDRESRVGSAVRTTNTRSGGTGRSRRRTLL